MTWLLSPEQVVRLVALQRNRDLQRIGDVLAATFQEARGRLGERWSAFVDQGAARAAAYGLTHMLCAARFLATWIACGVDFDKHEAWPATILTDAKRTQGAKAYQLCMQVLERLRLARQPGQPTAPDFSQAMRQLDEQLAAAGTIASLLPRERIKLGSPCDVDAVDLRLVDSDWRQRYTAVEGPWRREPCVPEAASLTLIHDPESGERAQLPARVTLISHAVSATHAARLRVRVKAEHRCDAHTHPLVQWFDATGARALRGDLAADITLPVYSPSPAADAGMPHIGEEDSPQFSSLTIAGCGLRARGVPTGDVSTAFAAYEASQHLIAWRREPAAAWQLPDDALPPILPARCRRERDGEAVDASAWTEGFRELDDQLQRGLTRLLTAWERESGVTGGKLAVDAALLVGSAGITWGWQERPEGIAVPPYMRLEGLLDLVACRLTLSFTGVFACAGSRSRLELTTDGAASLRGAWLRGPDDDTLFGASARAQVSVRQSFELNVRPLAEPSLALLSRSGPLQGAISGAVGLEQRPDGPGLRWFVRLQVEAVVAPLRVSDPVLGIQHVAQALLPAQPLVDWSLA